MVRIAFIIPFFGKFNSYFQLFLNSCKENSDLCDWLIFTDDRGRYNYPQNVKVFYTSFEELKKMFQRNFEFKIALHTPYKLCDYKVAYGYIFKEYIKEYSHWGHCDIDVIWGHISNFVDREMLDAYPKIFDLGHCTIYQNTYTNNRRFMEPIAGKLRYIEVFTHRDNCSFDEEYNLSINTIYESENVGIYDKSFAANIYTKSSQFRLTYLNADKEKYIIEPVKRNFFVWTKGKLLQYYIDGNRLLCKEYMYIHLQGRKMKNKIQKPLKNEFKIIPNQFEDLEISAENLNSGNYKKVRYRCINMHYFKRRGKNLILKILKNIRKKK